MAIRIAFFHNSYSIKERLSSSRAYYIAVSFEHNSKHAVHMYTMKVVRVFLLLPILWTHFSSETSQSSLIKRKRLWIQEHEKELQNTAVSSTVASGSTRIDSFGSSAPEKQRKISGSRSLRQSDMSERTSTQDNSSSLRPQPTVGQLRLSHQEKFPVKDQL